MLRFTCSVSLRVSTPYNTQITVKHDLTVPYNLNHRLNVDYFEQSGRDLRPPCSFWPLSFPFVIFPVLLFIFVQAFDNLNAQCVLYLAYSFQRHILLSFQHFGNAQFIFPASICCVSPSSDIRFDMAEAIACEYSAQSLIPCSVLILFAFGVEAAEGLLSTVVFIEKHFILRMQMEISKNHNRRLFFQAISFLRNKDGIFKTSRNFVSIAISAFCCSHAKRR